MSQTADAHHAPTSTGIDHKKLIMWLFLASDCMFFGTLISTHLLYRKLYPTGFTDAEGHQKFVQHLFNIELTSFSTFILLMSSFLMALAVSAMHKGQLKSFRRNVLGVIFFGLIFLGCQVYEFTHFYHQGLTIQNSVLGSTFYVLTGKRLPGEEAFKPLTGTETANSSDAQLYDLSDDAGEKKNLAAANADRVKAMAEKLAAFQKTPRTRP